VRIHAALEANPTRDEPVDVEAVCDHSEHAAERGM
jgi:hypothetical protein